VLTDEEIRLLGRLTADVQETAARFKRQGLYIVVGSSGGRWSRRADASLRVRADDWQELMNAIQRRCPQAQIDASRLSELE
jgi:hypothetical protein